MSESASFCPHCGSPQVFFEPSADTPGQLPVGAVVASPLVHRGIAWKKAVTSAVLISVPVAALNYVTQISIVGVIAGGIAVMALYRRRTAGVAINSRVGFRIGLLFGLLSAFLTAGIYGGAILVQRFALHDGGRIDSYLQAMIEQGTAQTAQSNPDAAAQVAEVLRYFGTPDGKAVLITSIAAFLGFVILAFSAMGGALGARIFSPRARSLHNP